MPTNPDKLVPVMVRFTPAEVALIDSRRGEVSRSAYVRECMATAGRLAPADRPTVHPSTRPAPSECVHPRDQRKKLPYGTLCQACNTMVA